MWLNTIPKPNVGFGFTKIFSENGGRCRTEYSEGTVVAWERFGVLVGYCQGNGDGHVRLTGFMEQKGLPPSPFLEIFTKMFSKCF
jgi:hypothetical protein